MAFNAAGYAAIANLMRQDDLVKANGRVLAGLYGAYIVGPLLATLLLTHWSVQVVLWCDALLSFLLSAGSLALIRTSFNSTPVEERGRSPLGRTILEGLRYVFSQPVVRALQHLAGPCPRSVEQLIGAVTPQCCEVLAASPAAKLMEVVHSPRFERLRLATPPAERS